MSQLQVTGEAKIRDLQGPVVANSGVITALDGAASQYVRGDGTLADFPSQTGGGSSVSYYLNGSVNQGTFGGSTYYQMSKNAITGAGTNFSTSANGLLAQFITDANDPDQTSIPSGNWNIEFFMGVSASSGALASFYVEFYKYDGSTFTLIATNVATPEFLTGTTSVESYFTSVAFAETPLATTDRLAIRIYANVASKTVTLYTEDNRLCQVVTTFSRGILSFNNLTDQQQYFAVGTSGTDFNIVSSLDTHTFNIPTASSTKRGLLSTTDWSTFNNKVPYTGATGPVNLGAYDLTVNDLTIGRGNGSVSDNTAIGVASLSSNTTGANNTAVGSGSLQSNTTGTQNSAFGAATLINNTTGNDNSALGAESLQNNTTGNQNTALGTTALKYNTTGYVNTAVGSEALLQNTTGSFNTAVGSATLSSNTTGTSNNAFGRGALNSNTTGANNVAIGNAALFGNINGNQNTAIGVSTLQNNVADENTAIGYAALNLNTFGEGNVAIGISALQNSTVASLNTAVGSYALWNNQTAAYNTAIGASALQSNLTGTRNTTLGWNSGSSITTGSNNTIIGVYTGTSAMSSNVILADGQGNIRYRFDGTNNNFYENVNLGENTYIGGFVQANGTSVLSGTISLKQNGFIPAATGYATIGSVSAGKLSIYFGESGLKSVELQNDLLTASRTYDFPDLSGTLALLEGSQTFSGSKSFTAFASFSGPTTKLGNGLYFDKGGLPSALTTTTTNLYSDSGNNNIVSQDNNNKSKLQFQGSSDYTYTFPASSGTIALTSNLSSYVPYTGATSNVNIGIYQLISGSISTGNVVSSSDVNTKGLFLDTANTTGALINGYSKLTATKSGTQTRLNYYTDNAGALIRLFFTNTSSYDYTFPDASGTLALTSNIPSVSGTSGQVTYFNGTSSVTGSSNHFWDATNNRLGIGLTNPQRSLEIYSATADSHLRLSGSAPSVSMGEAITGSVYQAKFGLATAAGQYVSGAVAGDFVMLSQTGATIFATSATEKMRLTSGGLLGIGTTSPSYLLDVNNSVDTYTQFRTSASDADVLLGFSNTGDGNNGWGIGRRNTGEFWIANYTGNFLGGTRTVPFQLASTGAATFSSSVDVATNLTLGNGTLFVSAGSGTGYSSRLATAYNFPYVDTYLDSFGGPSYEGRITFRTSTGGGALTSKMTILNSGNVGIGTSAPSNPLEVQGNVKINSSISGTVNLLFGISGTNYGSIKYNDSDGSLTTQTLGGYPLIFGTNITERMRITSGGDVCIGKTSYDNTTTGITLVGASGSGPGLGSFVTDGGACNLWNRKTSTGDIVIIRYNSSGVGSISTNGATTSYNITSDYRLKEDLKEINGLEKVSAIKVYDFKWKNTDLRMDGVIAHELQEIIPYAVVGEKDAINEDGTIKSQGVDYSKLVPILIKSIQEQQAQIEELKELIKNK